MGRLDKMKPYLTYLKKIQQDTGSVMHGLKASDKSFQGFGEAYFSSVNHQMVKGWKLHKKMTLNLIVSKGEIRFIVHEGSKAEDQDQIIPLIDIILGEKNYSRLTVPPGYWLAFSGIGHDYNILLNIANIEHDPEEAINQPLSFFKVKGVDFHE